MIKQINIKNYKSIQDIEFETSNLNVFIGANGCGKSNILEAIALASEAFQKDEVEVSDLVSKGIRITKPSLTKSSFIGQKQKNSIQINILFEEINDLLTAKLTPISDNIFSIWKNDSIKNQLVQIFNAYGKNSDNSDKAIIKWFSKEITPIIKQNITKEKTINASEKIINDVINDYSRSLLSKLNYSKIKYFKSFLIYNLSTLSLRGLSSTNSYKQPVGIYGEGLDLLIHSLSNEKKKTLLNLSKYIEWVKNIEIHEDDHFLSPYKLGKSTSNLYFQDKYMQKQNNFFSAENANEGILHFIFYIAFILSEDTPKICGIDNIETALNPKLCRELIKTLALLSIKNNKQLFITTHNPAILDGLNLNDPNQKLFVIERNDEGKTKIRQIKVKPKFNDKNFKLSELWMQGLLGGIPVGF